MDKKFTYEDVIFRLGYFRNKNNLSARDASLQLNYSDAEFNRIERHIVQLKVKTLIDFMNLINITPIEFFYENPENYLKNKELIDAIIGLSDENKEFLMELIKRLK